MGKEISSVHHLLQIDLSQQKKFNTQVLKKRQAGPENKSPPGFGKNWVGEGSGKIGTLVLAGGNTVQY